MRPCRHQHLVATFGDMQWVLPYVTDLDASGESLVAAVAAFEDATGREDSLDSLLQLASDLTGMVAGCMDQLNDREQLTPGAPAMMPIDGLRPADLPSDRAVEAEGRLMRRVDRRGRSIGVVWLGGHQEHWTTLHDAVLDRLAFATALECARVDAARQAELRLDPAALETLVAGGQSAEQCAYLAKRAGMSEQTEYVVVAARAPRQDLHPRVMADVVRRSLEVTGLLTRGFEVAEVAVVVTDARTDVDERLAAPGTIKALARCGAVLGIGMPALPRDLARSWHQARGAMALAPLLDGAPVRRFDDLGALALLGEIPARSIEATPDVRVLRRLLDFPAGEEDLRLLETFCETGGLRATAALMHMHHSSVRYRIDRLERELGFALEGGAGMLRALLAVKLLKIQLLEAGAATEWRTMAPGAPTVSG